MHYVARVAAYVPEGSVSGHRVAGADEDTFSMGATALERAMGTWEASTEPVDIHLLGDFPPMADWGFAVVVGGKAIVARHPSEAGELTRTIRSLEGMAGGPAVVVVAETPERSPEKKGPTPSPIGAGAVTYLLQPSDRSTAFPLERAGVNDSALALAFQRGKQTYSGALAQTFVGDWDVSPAVGRTVDLALIRSTADRDLSFVSEGAYVPRARYLENLPSRWRFVAEECDSCHEVTFPARGVCRRCRRRDDLTRISLPRDGGRVVAVTRIGKGGQPTEFDEQVASSGPYGVVLLEFPGGVRATLQLTDSDPTRVAIGARARTRLRRTYPMDGRWRYARKAIVDPAESPGR